jgi:hypothetical protein
MVGVAFGRWAKDGMTASNAVRRARNGRQRMMNIEGG